MIVRITPRLPMSKYLKQLNYEVVQEKTTTLNTQMANMPHTCVRNTATNRTRKTRNKMNIYSQIPPAHSRFGRRQHSPLCECSRVDRQRRAVMTVPSTSSASCGRNLEINERKISENVRSVTSSVVAAAGWEVNSACQHQFCITALSNSKQRCTVMQV